MVTITALRPGTGTCCRKLERKEDANHPHSFQHEVPFILIYLNSLISKELDTNNHVLRIDEYNILQEFFAALWVKQAVSQTQPYRRDACALHVFSSNKMNIHRFQFR